MIPFGVKKNIFVTSFLLVVFSLFLTMPAYSSDISALKGVIKEKGKKWSAGETPISKLSPKERGKRLGLILPSGDEAADADTFISIIELPAGQIPESFDWRDREGVTYVTSVKDQGACSGCWAYATTAALESKILISNLMPGIDLDLSEELLLTCSDGGDCSGGSASIAADFLRDKGITLENGIDSGNLLSCPADYPNINDCVYKISDWQWVTKRNAKADMIKKALYKYGPLVTSMQVYTDLYFYESGVYSHVNGTIDGYHSVVIVGYNDVEEYFIVKNSWGPEWGEEGFFRIAFSELESAVSFGDWTMAFMNAGISEVPNIHVEPSSHSFGVTDIGGTLQTTFTVSNVGKSDLLIGSLYIDGDNISDFTVSADTCSLQGIVPGGYCQVEVLFSPVDYGLKRAALVVPSNDSDTPELIIALDGISNQTGTTVISGQVNDESGNGLSGVTINLGNYQALTDKKGKYVIALLPYDMYRVNLSKGGYETITDSLNMSADKELNIFNFVMVKLSSNDNASDLISEFAGKGWVAVAGEPVTPTEARAYFKKKKNKLAGLKVNRPHGVITGTDLSTYPDELLELARGLKYDPLLIFDYVHNTIDYVPYYGYKKGPLGTYLSGQGNDFDQSSLLVALLRISSNYNGAIGTVNFEYGDMSIDFASAANWLGVDAHWQPLARAFSHGGIPRDCNSDPCTVSRLWVSANIDNVTYYLDPAFKEYEYFDNIDLAQAIGYNRSDFLLAAGSIQNENGTVFVENLNEQAIHDRLEQYSMNLINVIRSQYPNSSLEDVMGGRKIIETKTTELPASLPFPISGVFEAWSSISAEYTALLSISHTNGITPPENIRSADIEPPVFLAPDIYGKSFILVYNNQIKPVLKLDGVTQVTGTAATEGTSSSLQFFMDQPYPGGWNGNFCDKDYTVPIKNGKNNKYSIIFNFGDVSEKLIKKRRDTLERHKVQGKSDTSEEVMSEALNIMGLSYEKELAEVYGLLDGFSEIQAIVHGDVGIMAQTAHYYTSVQGLATYYNIHDGLDVKAIAYPVTATLGSALEHGVFEQLMGIEIPGISTTKIFDLANNDPDKPEQEKKIFYLNADTYPHTSGLLKNYDMDLVETFGTLVDNGFSIYLPQNGRISLGDWKGFGYIGEDPELWGGGIAMKIEGDLNGGYASSRAQANPKKIKNTTYAKGFDVSQYTNVKPQYTVDPVDMVSGAFVYSNTDLSLSGFALNRYYNSMMAEDKQALGHGWSHSYDIKLKKSTNANPGLGSRLPVEVASTLVTIFVAADITKNNKDVLGYTVMALSSNWAVDQLRDNSVSVQMGEKVTEFIKLPDGSYSAPPGITAELIDNGGTFTLKERFDRNVNFDANGKVTSITDADGNAVNFSYTSDKLDIVQDSFGHSLDFDYVGENLDKVTDSAGRIVSYDYDADNNLVSYTDTEQKSWTYGYDDPNQPHRMTTMKNPLNQTTVTNIYDASGRVIEQVVPRKDEFGNDYNVQYNLYFSGYRNEEQDPDGFGKVYYYDDKGRVTRKEDELGNAVSFEYDGQNHQVVVTDPLLRTTRYGYDGFNNLTAVTNELLQKTHFKYDAQFRQTDVIDPLGHTTHSDYDTEHHVTAVIDAETNDVTYTYYPNGKVHTTKDGRDVVTEVTAYDSNGNPRTTKVGNHPEQTTVYTHAGQLESLTDQEGSTTNFTYNSRGQLETKTDPLLRQASMTYDDAGRLSSVTDRNGDTLTYDYTISGKTTFLNSSSASGEVPLVSFIYNKHDELETMTDELGTTEYFYYPNRQLERVINPYGFELAYEYYATGNVKKVTYPGNKSVSYTYDELNRLKTVTIDWLAKTATYYYDAAGRLDYFENFNGIITDPTFDNADRMTDLVIDNGNIASYNFTLDGNGNRTNVVKTEPLAAPRITVAESYTYNDKKNRLETAGASSFGYDLEGQLDSKDGDTYTFDRFHRLRNINGSVFNSYDYDGGGNRLSATRGGVETRYVYDTSGNLVAEADANNQITRYYIYGAGLLGLVTAADQVYVYHFDANANTIAITDSAQQMVNKYAYTPFGIIADEVEAVAQPFKFAGQVGIMTEPNGVYYMRARYYDPQVGRFISEDPIGFEGGDVNLFAYVQNDPINLTDPDGLNPVALNLVKKGLNKVHELVGGSLPKGNPGKFGSPQRGTPKKGYRLDPPHPDAPVGSPEAGPHINWWDYTKGKRGKGGISGAEALVGVVSFIGSLLDPFGAEALANGELPKNCNK